MSVKHLHHIIPKHVEINNSPDNLVELSVEEQPEGFYKERSRYEK